MLVRGLTVSALLLGLMGHGLAADLDVTKKAPIEAAPVQETSFFSFSDTQVSFRYQFPSAEPGVQVQKADGSLVGRGIPKYVTTIAHVDAWEYGTNFFSLEILKAASQSPAGTTNAPGGFAEYDYGATEAYGIYRGTLSLNALTKTKAFVLPGIVKDVSLSYGFDANAKNTAFGPTKRAPVGGLSFAMDVPAGFLNVSVQAYKEWSRNGFNLQPYRDVSFDTAPEFEIVYNFPLNFLPNVPLSIAGFDEIIMPKGRGVTQVSAFPTNPKTGLEFLSRTNLVLDVGKMIWNQPNKLDAFVGFQYWLNKYGTEETATLKGTEEKSFLAGIIIHVF